MYNNFQYLGTQLTSPLSIQRGRATTVTGVDTIRQSLERILSTPKGSVFFNREYGSRIEEMLFEPNNDVASEMLRYYIYEAIEAWEPRVKFLEAMTYIEDATIQVHIKYRVLSTNEVQALVYPFYRQV